MTILMLYAGEKYNTSTLIKHVGASPEVSIETKELEDATVSFVSSSATIGEPENRHIAVYKTAGRYMVLLGRDKLAELRAKGQATVKVRLITKHVLKHCLPAPLEAQVRSHEDNQTYEARRFPDRQPAGGGYPARRYDQPRRWQ